MILNAYAVLVLLTNAIRLPVALLVVVLSAVSVMRYRQNVSSEGRQSVEHRTYLLVLLLVLLMILNILSWPLFYLMLQSYVPQWKGVMCIYGVTKIGTGSLGAARFLPSLLFVIQLLKPVMLFLCGTWFVVYWVNRESRSAGLMRLVLAMMLVAGATSLVDSGLESAYVAIPKRENIPEVGCCTAAGALLHSRLVPASLLQADRRGWLAAAYYGLNIAMIVALAGQFTFLQKRSRQFWLHVFAVGTLVAIPVSFLFLVEIAAPIILHLPLHHCAYDLVGAAPESVVGIGLFVMAALSVGWAWLAARFNNTPGSETVSARLADRATFLALFGFVTSLALISTELVLNWYA